MHEDAIAAVEPAHTSDEPRDETAGLGLALSFRTRLTLALIASAIVPLGVFGALVYAMIGGDTVGRLLLFVIAVASLVVILVAYVLAAALTGPLRAIAAAVDRVSSGDLSRPIVVPGDDEVARLAASHNRLTADLERRNRELGKILAALERTSPKDGVEWLAGRAGADAREAFGMIDATVHVGDPREIPDEERVPGEARQVKALLRAGADEIGVLVGRLQATREWERADQDLLDLFASEIAVAIRNAQLFERVEAQNAQLIELDAAKDDFLRGVSHNLQTPLTRIRAYAEQLGGAAPDRRLGIIVEQSERLSRMVRQLLTVTRLESGALKPRSEVLAPAPRVRRAWEALAAEDVAFTLDDTSRGWLAVADGDQLDQVLWALLDNAVKYGASGVDVRIGVDDTTSRIRVTVEDHGPGVAEADRGRLFQRFARGQSERADEGSGLGLYVSRELCRAMGGDLVLERTQPGHGAAFTVVLPGEAPEES
ncbi:MAG: ATP-binding protein [Chloroflexota bacterium]